MTWILGKEKPIQTNAVLIAEVGKCFIGNFVASFDHSEILWIKSQSQCDIAVFYFVLLCLLREYKPYTLHDIMKNNHGTPLW